MPRLVDQQKIRNQKTAQTREKNPAAEVANKQQFHTAKSNSLSPDAIHSARQQTGPAAHAQIRRPVQTGTRREDIELETETSQKRSTRETARKEAEKREQQQRIENIIEEAKEAAAEHSKDQYNKDARLDLDANRMKQDIEELLKKHEALLKNHPQKDQLTAQIKKNYMEEFRKRHGHEKGRMDWKRNAAKKMLMEKLRWTAEKDFASGSKFEDAVLSMEKGYAEVLSEKVLKEVHQYYQKVREAKWQAYLRSKNFISRAYHKAKRWVQDSFESVKNLTKRFAKKTVEVCKSAVETAKTIAKNIPAKEILHYAKETALTVSGVKLAQLAIQHGKEVINFVKDVGDGMLEDFGVKALIRGEGLTAAWYAFREATGLRDAYLAATCLAKAAYYGIKGDKAKALINLLEGTISLASCGGKILLPGVGAVGISAIKSVAKRATKRAAREALGSLVQQSAKNTAKEIVQKAGQQLVETATKVAKEAAGEIDNKIAKVTAQTGGQLTEKGLKEVSKHAEKATEKIARKRTAELLQNVGAEKILKDEILENVLEPLAKKSAKQVQQELLENGTAQTVRQAKKQAKALKKALKEGGTYDKALKKELTDQYGEALNKEILDNMQPAFKKEMKEQMDRIAKKRGLNKVAKETIEEACEKGFKKGVRKACRKVAAKAARNALREFRNRRKKRRGSDQDGLTQEEKQTRRIYNHNELEAVDNRVEYYNAIVQNTDHRIAKQPRKTQERFQMDHGYGSRPEAKPSKEEGKVVSLDREKKNAT